MYGMRLEVGCRGVQRRAERREASVDGRRSLQHLGRVRLVLQLLLLLQARGDVVAGQVYNVYVAWQCVLQCELRLVSVSDADGKD